MATTPTAERPASQDATSPAKTTDKPVATFRFGHVSAAVFPRKVKLPDGKFVTAFDTSLRKSFHTDEGWAHTHTLGVNDLLPGAYALMKAADFIIGSHGTEAE